MKRFRDYLVLALGLGALLVTAAPVLTAADAVPVRAWEENIVIPTYLAGAPEPNPMFNLGGASQGDCLSLPAVRRADAHQGR